MGYPEWSLTHDGLPPRISSDTKITPILPSSSTDVNEDSDADDNEDTDNENDNDEEFGTAELNDEEKGIDAQLKLAEAKAVAKENRRLHQQAYRALVRKARDAPLVLACFHRDYIKRLQVTL